MMQNLQFRPGLNSNYVVTPNSSSASTTLTAQQAQSNAIRFVNSGVNICYVATGNDTVIASTASTPVLPNSAVILRKSFGDNIVSYISASGTTLNFQTGEGGI